MRTNTELSEREESFRELGLLNIGRVYWDNSTPALYEEAIRRYEGMVSHLGPLVIRTGQYTGRLPKDKILVPEPSSEQKIWLIQRSMERAQKHSCFYISGRS